MGMRASVETEIARSQNKIAIEVYARAGHPSEISNQDQQLVLEAQ